MSADQELAVTGVSGIIPAIAAVGAIIVGSFMLLMRKVATRSAQNTKR